jgi:hypothetical protein
MNLSTPHPNRESSSEVYHDSVDGKNEGTAPNPKSSDKDLDMEISEKQQN